jgi:WD40 repeat protein
MNTARMRRARLWLCLAAAMFGAAGCDLIDYVIPRKGAIPDAPFAGDRPDAPPLAQRGNATFASAAFDDTGKLLVTASFMGSAAIQVWDVQTGALIADLDAGLPQSARDQWMIDSKRERLLAHRRSGTVPALFDLRTGREIAYLPDVEHGAKPRIPAGLTGDGDQAVFFVPGALELWQLDPPQLLLRVDSPLAPDHYIPGCVGGIFATYNDKRCWEWSPDHRTLAVAYTPVFSPMSESHFYVIDAATLAVQEIRMPSERASRTLASFAFSPDNRWLAIGTDRELLLFDLVSATWGPTIAGDHKRNRLLGAMRFTADSRRIITLGDVLQVSVYDVATGERFGRAEPAFDNWEGVFAVSRDGSRIVIYKFVSDTFEVLDGADAKRLGWVCPYFCNAKHNPVQPPYAVSPDGKSVAISHRRGTAVWDTATDKIRFPLMDPQRKPLPYPYSN